MSKRRSLIFTAATVVFALVVGRVLGNQIARYRFLSGRAATHEQRQALFDMLQPVALAKCRLERFGEPHDGGYLMCGNLLDEAEVGYSYGISGYDQWGCDISRRFGVTVHQYDCFDTTQPACPGGRTVFHAECVGDSTKTEEGRLFDTIANQQATNGDTSKRVVLKIDVEGAEWNSFLATPDEVLKRIDQLVVEFHWIEDQKSLAVVQRLKQFFEVAHIHFNNASCIDGMEPFPTWAYEVLFVNKRLAVVDSSPQKPGLHSLDAPNNPTLPDCQPVAH
jgi:hypothetical protein